MCHYNTAMRVIKMKEQDLHQNVFKWDQIYFSGNKQTRRKTVKLNKITYFSILCYDDSVQLASYRLDDFGFHSLFGEKSLFGRLREEQQKHEA
jgi:hypothetical protein